MKRIILVEDDAAILEIYQTMLKKEGFDVKIASSGQEILSKIKKIERGEEEKPDLILLDLILPDINGMEVLKAIKSSEAVKSIKVFVLTNQEKSSGQADGIKPDKFIVKANVSPTKLVEIIKEDLA